MLEYTPEVLKTYVHHIIKNSKIVTLLIFLEFLTIWVECIDSVSRILQVANGNPTVNADVENLTKLSALNPLYYIQKLILSDNLTTATCTSSTCGPSNIITLAVGIGLFILILLHHLSCLFIYTNYTKKEIARQENTEGSKLFEIFNFVSVNLLDLLYKVPSVFAIYFFMNKFFVSFALSADLLYGILSIVFLVLFLLGYLFQVNYVVLMLKMDGRDTLHYDSFSQNYDYLFFILKIIISFNKNLLLINTNNVYQKHVIALDYIILFLILNFVIKMILNIMRIKSLTLVTNLKLNLFRLFLCIFLCIYFSLYIFFNYFSVYDTFIISLSSLLITFCIITYLYTNVYRIIYTDEKIIYQLAYLIDLLLTGDWENPVFEKEIIKIQTLHNKKCSFNKCEICSAMIVNISGDNKEPEKTDVIFKMIAYIENRLIQDFSHEENDFFNFMNLVFNYNLTSIDSSISPIKIIYKTKDQLVRNLQFKNTYYMNLLIFYTKINRQSENNINKFILVKKFDTSINSLSRSLEIVSQVVNTVDSRVKKDLYPLTSELNKNKKIILNNLADIFEQRKTYNDTFAFVMSKFVFERTFNVDCNSLHRGLGESEDFESRLDMVDDRFCKDSVIVVNYKVAKDTLLITRASKKFVKLSGKYFEDLFPKNLCILARQRFIEAFNSNLEEFTFQFVIESQKKFLRGLKLECKIFRSADLQELFIFSKYEHLKDDIIIFEVPYILDINTFQQNYNFGNSKLIGFSESLEKILCLTPRLVDFFLSSKLKKKSVAFPDLFNKNKYSRSSERIVENDYILSYRSYYSNFFEDIQNNSSTFEDEEINKKLSEIRPLSDQNMKINATVQHKFTIIAEETLHYVVYSVKVQGKQLNQQDGEKTDSNENNAENILDEVADLQSQSSQKFGSPGTASSVSGGAITSSVLNSITVNGKKTTFSSENNMFIFRFLTLLINVSLGIYCIVFLIIGFGSNQKMTEVNDLKFYYSNFERSFYQTTMSLLYNVGVYKKNSQKSIDDYDQNNFWASKTGLTINMGDYANSELQVKTDLLNSEMSALQDFIYNSYFKSTIEPMFTFTTNQKIVNFAEEVMGLSSQYPNFFDSVTMFINNAKASRFFQTKTMINIFNYNMAKGSYDLSSINNQNITDVQKAVYEVVVNFPNYYNNLNKIWRDLDTLFSDEVSYIFNLNVYLSLLLIFLHLFLILISITIINFLKRMTGESNYILSKLISGEWTNYMNLKYANLKEMLLFYKNDPVKISRDLRKEQRDTMRVNREKQNEEKKNEWHEKVNLKQNSFDTEIAVDSLINPLFKTLFYLFSFYLIYSVSFLIIFNFSNSDIILSSDYQSSYYKVDKCSMNSIILLQCILFSNQTDLQLGSYLKNYTNFIYENSISEGYIMDLIEDSKLHSNFITSTEKNRAGFSSIETTAETLFNCEYLYSNVNDGVFSKMKNNFEGNILRDNLITLCKQYPVMQNKKLVNLIEDLNFSATKMIRQYLAAYGNYNLMKNINDYPEFIDEMTKSIFILRPIQTYIFSQEIRNLTVSSGNFFLLCVILFMIGNILVECLIFFVINRKLILRVLDINEEIRCLTLCIAA
jgi:hypothetical protein